MAYEQKNGELVIFKNEKKTDRQPDYKGRGLDLNGQEIEIALWVKQGKEQKFFSARIQYKQQQQQQPAQQQWQQAPPPTNNDTLPF